MYGGRVPEKRLPRSVRKFLRRKKAEIRRRFLSRPEAEAKVRELVERTFGQYTGSSVNPKITKDTTVTKEAKEAAGPL